MGAYRGGGEYGTKWRDAGSLGNKQNVFDDFQACAEHLITEGYCSSETLTIEVDFLLKAPSQDHPRT